MEEVKFMIRKIKNREYPAEFYWDDKFLLYKRGNTASIVELAKLTRDEFKRHFSKLFGELLKYHKNDELAQEGFFLPEFEMKKKGGNENGNEDLRCKDKMG